LRQKEPCLCLVSNQEVSCALRFVRVWAFT
jgi:hypothetical protein